ncbi:Protein kinase domain [Macleaya cordata]|uniref:Receptor-like serine/threonine-protein kinase n=1 Tax=Macleaya cordata TaxID=56857 RepID=A0A200QTR7_MACCD|nr:Protein kinase domain [Macleaya cordata]
MNWVDNDGLFLLSNNSNYAFGFTQTQDVTLFLLVVVHISTSRVIWTANRDSLVRNSDKFLFDKSGNVYLESGGSSVWSTDTVDKGVTSMELQDSGNLVLIGENRSPIWQSFSHPTDTLLSGQDFLGGMKLVSNSNSNKMSYYLEIQSGDVLLYASFPTPQPYWSIKNENRRTINEVGGNVNSASLVSNSWRFFDRNKGLLWQFIFSANSDSNVTWAAVLDSDGLISFYNLQSGGSVAEKMKIPQDPCRMPESCSPYYVCSGNNQCQCPAVLSSFPNCDPGVVSSCNSSKGPMELMNVGNKLDYFALGFVQPNSKSDLNSCKNACLKNCSCVMLFFETSSGNCFLFDQIGSLQFSKEGSSGFVSYIKVSSNGNHGSNSGGSGSDSEGKHFPFVVIIVVGTVLIIAGLIYLGLRYHRRKKKLPDPPQDDSEEDNFLENLAGMPIRFSYKELEEATNNFTVKLGQGGFGSVYRGTLKDGTQLAVKKLEGIGQGTKEFRAEVSIIGSIHHIHLVRLKGFCAEGTHRLLVYEYMAKGSLEKWIFKKNNENYMLDWDTRFNIALGTAKGLAYLHEDCDAKIVHCDIKPENVLLDDNYVAKVSDFGLAKLMTREQSHVFTTLRGTRGYLAPEWITNYAISEKSDVYSFGMVLLEIIGGRKNFDQSEKSEKAHFPSYAIKMAEEGKLEAILDPKLKIDKEDERVSNAIKVALWCIQEDMHLRPSMSKVVQMLEGVCIVPQPPTTSQMGHRLHSSFFKSVSDDGTSSGQSDCFSDAYLSAVRLSGPR